MGILRCPTEDRGLEGIPVIALCFSTLDRSGYSPVSSVQPPNEFHGSALEAQADTQSLDRRYISSHFFLGFPWQNPLKNSQVIQKFCSQVIRNLFTGRAWTRCRRPLSTLISATNVRDIDTWKIFSVHSIIFSRFFQKKICFFCEKISKKNLINKVNKKTVRSSLISQYQILKQRKIFLFLNFMNSLISFRFSFRFSFRIHLLCFGIEEF